MPTLAEITSHSPLILVGLAIALALAFEFVNGFHDTANAVATVIYTHTLKPNHAVIWSGIWNLIGVLVSNGAVAFGIVALLPVELVLHVGSGSGVAMVFALLVSAIIWNVGTWYLGLPASSSHTLIGSILGVGLANSFITGHGFAEGVNWAKAKEVGLSLLISPVFGFVCAGLLLLLMKKTIKKPELFIEPDKEKAPPRWIRGILFLTCTGVSFAHGSNDGQKGMGLMVLILVGMLPGAYALKMSESPEELKALVTHTQAARTFFESKSEGAKISEAEAPAELEKTLKPGGTVSAATYAALSAEAGKIESRLSGVTSIASLSEEQRRDLRSDIYLVTTTVGKISKSGKLTDAGEAKTAADFKKSLDGITNFIPLWVKGSVALALGLGTMIGWKRIVVTVGEKIGKTHLTYAQGAAAESVAMVTIAAADTLGLPVSTTHILSSGVAGTMAANRSGLQMATLRNILLAWVLTLPVCIFLGSLLFAFANYAVLHWFGMK